MDMPRVFTAAPTGALVLSSYAPTSFAAHDFIGTRGIVIDREISHLGNLIAKPTSTNARKCNLSSRIVCNLSPARADKGFFKPKRHRFRQPIGRSPRQALAPFPGSGPPTRLPSL